MKPDKAMLPELSQQMEDWSPLQILEWAWETYGSGLTMATAFGAEGCVIIAMLSQISKDIHIFNLDTGYQLPETLETRQRLMDKYAIDIPLVRAQDTVAEMEATYGGPIYGSQPDLCCHLRKVVPLETTLTGFDAWISAIRRDQALSRRHAAIVGWDKKFDLVKINPLANWTKRDVWNYILTHDVPYNPLHDQGYPSIGCGPCTKAVGASDDERAGRWAGTAKKECGLHIANNTPAAVS